ncbi:hypothetical protein BKI52_10365 [marine bacterium AO1-C]|nr:hypothetical protein BKI52_10365 [marine bacterium AO1-C]
MLCNWVVVKVQFLEKWCNDCFLAKAKLLVLLSLNTHNRMKVKSLVSFQLNPSDGIIFREMVQ